MNARLPLALAVVTGAALVAPPCLAAGGVDLQGTEYPLTVRNPGDQVNASVALGSAGGWIVWQDAAADGQGLGIAALRLNETHSPQAGGAFRVNATAAGDQENARVSLLENGGAFIVWQGGELGYQRIFGRVLGPNGTFASEEIAISSGAGEHQIEPQVATLASGEVVVVWSSYRQDGVNYDVYGRLISAAGQPIAPEFRVNQELGLGRRAPSVTGLAGGGFLVAWVGERIVGERNNRDASGRVVPGTGAPTFDISVHTRVFEAGGTPVGGDVRLPGSGGIPSHPALVPLPGGRVLLAWTRRDPASRDASLDVFSRVLNADGQPAGPELRLNDFTYGDQYRPRLAASASGVFAVWSSMGQDGSWEGVYGRWLTADGALEGEELRLNTTVGGGQLLPTTGATPEGQILVAWSSNLPQSGLELFAQRLAANPTLQALPAPVVSALSPSSVMVSWPAVAGLPVAAYRVFSPTGAQLAEVTDNFWVTDGLAPASSFAVEVAYVLTSGDVSPKSAAGTGRTWGTDKNFDGLPDDWQVTWWPGATSYPPGSADSDGDGVSNLDEWLAGTDPTDSRSSLKVRWTLTPLGLRVEWPTQAGFVYQLQTSANGREWTAAGGPRFAADRTDSVTLAVSGPVSFYRVLRVR